ncbi:carbohydrate ABC transporter permease [Xylanimonas protaetiae]|uniref:Carbohydrate ABC transporter permease n=1 Tax=Xylanimonas protaetiae TaxID=2509457 RepID=A0A4P6FLY0_9MICO|nr:carbohydrate ABC transporter permease [Xylanimonas protaetiae]QAY71648.1 carbohydrate ABC transporter permease [Xylanimonas protaetiae]
MSTLVAPTTDTVDVKVAKEHKRRANVRQRAGQIFTYTALSLVCIVFIYPLIWLVSASFKPRGQVFDNRLIPRTFQPENYRIIWEAAPVAQWLVNSLVITTLAALAVAASSALVAWGFTYFQFKWRDRLFALVLGTMMLPAVVTMIPEFLVWSGFGLVGINAPFNGTLPMWAHNLFGSAFYIFLLRQFFMRLPRDVFEAAKVDGAGNWRIFWQIGMPLARPALVVTILFEAQAAWTNLQRALIYLQDSSTFTVPRGLKAVVDRFGAGIGGEQNWELVMTAAVVTTLPLIILFFFGQKQFVDGIATTGSKG